MATTRNKPRNPVVAAGVYSGSRQSGAGPHQSKKRSAQVGRPKHKARGYDA